MEESEDEDDDDGDEVLLCDLFFTAPSLAGEFGDAEPRVSDVLGQHENLDVLTTRRTILTAAMITCSDIVTSLAIMIPFCHRLGHDTPPLRVRSSAALAASPLWAFLLVLAGTQGTFHLDALLQREPGVMTGVTCAGFHIT